MDCDWDDAHKAAYRRGMIDGLATGPDSLFVLSPYDPDSEESLYDAWDRGCGDAGGLGARVIFRWKRDDRQA